VRVVFVKYTVGNPTTWRRQKQVSRTVDLNKKGEGQRGKNGTVTLWGLTSGVVQRNWGCESETRGMWILRET